MYITDSNGTLNGVSRPCTILIRSFDGGRTWLRGAGVPVHYHDGEIISGRSTNAAADGMPSGVSADDDGIAVPLEVWSGKYKMTNSRWSLRTDAATNWRSDQSIQQGGEAPKSPRKNSRTRIS